MKTEEKTEKKRGRERGRKPLTASGATLTPTRRLSNLYLPSDQNDQTQTNSPIPMADSQSYAAGDFDVFRFPDLFAGGTFSPVESQIEANPALGSVPARNVTKFRAAVKSDVGRRIMRGNIGDLRRGKILGTFYSTACRPDARDD